LILCEHSLLIFDFDGTIADSLHALLECINNNAHYYGYKKIDDVEALRNKEAAEILKELGLSICKLPFVVQAVRNDMRSKIHALQPVPEIAEVLTQLHKKEIGMSIITSNATENVEIFLRNHNLNFFKHIHGQSSIFGKSNLIKKFLASHKINAAKTIYVGDETRDIEAAKHNKIKSAAVTWGFNSSQKLREKNPDYMLHHPKELFDLIA